MSSMNRWDDFSKAIVLALVFGFFAWLFLITKAHGDEIDDIIPYVIQVESNGNPNAVSKCGAVGLMQITPIVLEEYNQFNNAVWHMDYTVNPPKQWVDPKPTMNDMKNWKKNVQVGEWYLRRLKDHYLKENYTIERMLAAYNGGPTRLKSVGYDISKMPRETRQYVKKIMQLYKDGR